MAIFGARFSADGLQDPEGAALAGSPNNERGPRVARCDENFWAFWTDDRFAPENSTDVLAARVTPEGDIVDTEAIPIISTTFDDGLLIVYRSYFPTGDGNTARAGLYAVLLDDTLSVRVAPTQLSDSTINHTVIADGNRALLFNQLTTHDAERLVLQTLTVTDEPLPTETDSDSDSETDSDSNAAPAARASDDSGCTAIPQSNDTDILSLLFALVRTTGW